ncbi:MAG: transketolase [Clostridia bacterium]|nr:transketolase [Clostridia bacterium]
MSLQQATVNAIRILSAEAIQKANSGHPGLPLGCAPIGYALFQKFLKFNNLDVNWDNRDRFILSAGHGSMLYYSLLYLYGFGLSKDDLASFRQLGSKTPGHPEYGQTLGVETTTGPLGQGIANAVGMALAEAHLAAKFNRKGFPIVDHYTYALCGDGCLEEGISYEACSFAGAHKLGKLILFYDDNEITIEGKTDITFKEDIAKRFTAQNWQVIKVDLTKNTEDKKTGMKKPDNIGAISNAIRKARREKHKPSIIIFKTKIGYGSPLEGSEKIHGAPLGEENIQLLKEKLGWTCEEEFEVPWEVLKHTSQPGAKGAKLEQDWKSLLAKYAIKYPDLADEYKAAMSGELPNFEKMKDLLVFDKSMSTREASSVVLNKMAALVPSIVGGSADLGPSNMSIMQDTDTVTYGDFSAKNHAGRNIHFGVREHAMAAISNGIQLHGGLRPYCSTFFTFSDYCKPAMRLSALMNIPVTYVFTHDSIGVGEDGPTHQPIEQLISLRSIPNMKVFRPADGKEVVAAWISALKGNSPTALVLSRQTLPQYKKSGLGALKGGYILEDCKGKPDVILMASGSEVDICMQARAILHKDGMRVRVVSMPCLEEFEKQDEKYKESVLPAAVKARICVEAGSPHSWYKYVGELGEIFCMHSFGKSAPAPELFKKYGFTVENIVQKAKQTYNKLWNR